MILITVRLFGFSLRTWHIATSLNLPNEDYKVGFSIVQLEITLSPPTTPPPAHSVAATKVETPNQHLPAPPNLDPTSHA